MPLFYLLGHYKELMMGNLLLDNEKFEIRPEDIDTNDHFWDTFDNHETEVSARWIVRFCQHYGTWKPFSDSAIEGFYNSYGLWGFSFNRLIKERWIQLIDEKYYVTMDFVIRIYSRQHS